MRGRNNTTLNGSVQTNVNNSAKRDAERLETATNCRDACSQAIMSTVHKQVRCIESQREIS